MLIIFSVNDQKITHDLKGQLVAGSVDIVQAAFKFDSSWDELDKIVVFTSSACPKPALDSAAIRALGKTGKAYAAGTLTINVPVGAQRVAIACIATAKGVTKVINETAMNADVTSTFTKSTVSVEGANGYAAKDYNVWVFEPAVAYGNAAVLKVTLG